MMSSIPAYNEYAKTVLMPKMDPAVLAEVLAIEARKDFDNPRYAELLMANFYTAACPADAARAVAGAGDRTFAKMNREVYVPMQGPSEMGASGKLEHWDRSADLAASRCRRW